MEQYSFATIVTSDPKGIPFATHMPIVLDRTRGLNGTLVSHMARANPQWKHFQQEQEILAIFQGPHAYISPSWYEGEFNVPTWNYAVVHVYGIPKIVEDTAVLLQIMTELVATYEHSMPEPWRVPWADERITNLLKAIVGFELEITRLEGKFKLNQNKAVADQLSVVKALRDSANQLESMVAQMMTNSLGSLGSYMVDKETKD
ncbi:FMN-binding negative transcriptional regulator [Chloroflexi bacterium TSY]|nr:FMN-binding negative transcriptional regulator [Chloroflexi bacterium TSY]